MDEKIIKETRIVSEKDFAILQEASGQLENYKAELFGVCGDLYQAEPLNIDGKNIESPPVYIPKGFVAVILETADQASSNNLANSKFFDLWKKFYVVKYGLNE